MKRLLLTSILIFTTLTTFAQTGWQQQNVPHTDSTFLYIIDAPNAKTVWAEPYDLHYDWSNIYKRTIDGGKTWTTDSMHVIPNTTIVSIAAYDADTCFATIFNNRASAGTYIIKTKDGGKTWLPLDSSHIYKTGFADDIYFWNAKEGIAIGDPNIYEGKPNSTPFFELYKTYDGGNTWARIDSSNMPKALPDEYPYWYSRMTIGNNIWIVTFGTKVYDTLPGNRILISNDRGLHWRAATIKDSGANGVTVPVNMSNSAFVDSLHGFTCYGLKTMKNPLYSTNDGGMTWKEDTTYKGPFFGACLANVPGTNYLVSCSDGRFTYNRGSSYSRDFGHTWILIDSGANALHNNMKFLSDSFGWGSQLNYKGSDPGGIFKWNGFDRSPVEVPVLQDDEINIYPNPSSGIFNIDLPRLPNGTDISIHITDLMGKIVFINNLNILSGSGNVRVDLSNYPKGIYMLSIETGNNITVKKIENY